ncbi:uncharacterized protein si:ch211-188c16.1 isoform X1 [Takifugu flavidus]|uniref:uncharacterized protein si:ch211-188c16.1 isoform X1 n=1 Tax=Takifugu flavidus TaxID=433684 RepID=UPI002544083B|nr:uncharacterized protein si:ch211-188c16.1 isoform X1 [Takifugu flavidus]
MDEGSINVKALRAKFQEEASQAQSKTGRPAVAEKPKRLPPSGGPRCSVVSTVNAAVDNRTPAVSRVVFRDSLQASGGMCPISFPPKVPQTSQSFQHGSSDTTTRQSLRERHMPLVLPFIPVKEHKSELPATRELKLEEEPGKEAAMQTKIKKKGLLLPFKSSKAAKISGENGEPTYSDLTIRPSSAPGELPSVEKPPVEDRLSFQSNQSTPELPISSPDVPVSPPPTGTSVESDNKIVSTLERARKKLSCRQMLLSAKSLCSPDYASKDKTFPSPPRKTERAEMELPIPSPVCLPNLSCLSARPFFKANNSAHKSALDKPFGKEKAEILPVRMGLPSSGPLKKPLPPLRSLGPVPPKPPRPPVVDLSYFHLHTCNGPEQEAESTSVVLGAPEFPDFDHPEIETAEGEAVDIGALDLEAVNLVCTRTPPPDQSERTDSLCGLPEPLLSSDVDGSHLESASLPDPVNIPEFPKFPVSELWSQSEDVSFDPQFNPHTDEAEKGDRSDSHPSELHRHGYDEAEDNVYEDVEGVKKMLLEQNWRKRKAGLKNPYADSHFTDGAGLHTWPPHPRVPAEPVHPTHIRVPGKERHSPHTAEYKEQKKREKQRLEKEKKEQREREKRENEMKKKFKVTGEEEPMYHARVMVASKVRKNDLPVKNGDTVSIIRTTSCPKGKWLARDANNRYGYISVMNVELNIKEMLELGKKAQAAGRGGATEGDTISIGSRSSNQPVLTSSFTDDSEEWACEDETLSFCNKSHSLPSHTSSMAETSCGHAGAQHTLSDANLEDLHTQTRHEALQKLAIFFQHSKDDCADVPDGGGATPTNPWESAGTSNFLSGVEEPPFPDQEADFTEVELFPPPPLYADFF